jgi:DNA-binding HxlR family transcriptional regulator
MHGTLCPRFHKAIELIGGRWTGPILQLLMGGAARFAELRESIPNISDRMLSERLRALEQEGLVSRHVLPDPPVRVEYALTEKGKELHASLAAIGKWAERWIPAADASRRATPSTVQTRKARTRPRPSARR